VADGKNHPDKAPAERALELLVYAPVGLALYVRDMLPSMMGVFVMRGKREVGSRRVPSPPSGTLPDAPEVRRRLEEGLGVARGAAESGIGVARGVAEAGIGTARGLAGAQANFARDVAGTALQGLLSWRSGEASAWPTDPAPTRSSAPPSTLPTESTPAPAPATSPPPDASWATSVPASDALPIPDYDELSASQVVERLDGLDRASLEAIRRYESEHRGRNTILGKITQLT
jgi:hypothetical protein